MLRSCRFFGVGSSLWLLACLGTACFGKVEYDAAAALGGAGPSASGGTEPDPLVPPVRPADGAGSGGAPLVEPPLNDEPTCVVDCCPSVLTQVTRAGDGGSLDAGAERPYVSGDGMWVVFASWATNLGDHAASGHREVYVYSLAKRVLFPIVGADGRLLDGDSEPNALSADGRWILFTSRADSVTSGDQAGLDDVFLLDRGTSAITRVSSTSTGAPGNGASLGRDLSPDGRYVVYSSAASDLTENDDNGAWDVFVWDRLSGVTERVSMGPGDQQANPVPGNHAHISADGRYVSFHSQSDLLVPSVETDTFDIFLVDRQLGTTVKVSETAAGNEADGNTFVLGMSDDARYLSSYGSATNLVPADTNGQSDVFLFDRTLGTVARVNLGPGRQQADIGSSSAALSHDGTYLTFASASNLLGSTGDGFGQQSYAYETQSGRLLRLSQDLLAEPGNADSTAAELSASSRCFVFTSAADNLTADSTPDDVMDVFVGRLR